MMKKINKTDERYSIATTSNLNRFNFFFRRSLSKCLQLKPKQLIVFSMVELQTVRRQSSSIDGVHKKTHTASIEPQQRMKPALKPS